VAHELEQPMCHVSCVVFVAACCAANPELVSGKRVLEIGSRGGSIRPILLGLRPAAYVGSDLFPGPGVDVVCDAAKLLEVFPAGGFDLVISTETLEHVRDWHEVVSSIQRLCAPGGTVVITTRSPGFPYHGVPDDFWRYSIEDMAQLFAGWEIGILSADPEAPGVFLLARRKGDQEKTEVPSLSLFSVVEGKRVAVTCHPSVGTLRRVELTSVAELRSVLRRLRSKVARRNL
jgi:SAM-dependent methyltransferase